MYRKARSIDTIFIQLDKLAPHRSKKSDGWIGNAEHATRDSDHNPWVLLGQIGIVTAADLTHDPKHGADMHLISERIRASKDNRLKYLIFNERIFRAYPKDGIHSWGWSEYHGKNPHHEHLHLSVASEVNLYDDPRQWHIYPPKAPNPRNAGSGQRGSGGSGTRGVLAMGSRGKDVEYLQRWLGVKETGVYGETTRAAVMKYQKMRGLNADGIVGPVTWKNIEGK